MSKLMILVAFSMAVIAMYGVKGSGQLDTDDHRLIKSIATRKPTHPPKLTPKHPPYTTKKPPVHLTTKQPLHTTKKPSVHYLTTKHPRYTTKKPPARQSSTTTKTRRPTTTTPWPLVVPACTIYDGEDFDREDYEELLSVVDSLLLDQNYDPRRMVPWSACNQGQTTHEPGEKWILAFFDSQTTNEHICIAEIMHYPESSHHKSKPRHNNYVITRPVCQLDNVELCPGQLKDIGRCTTG